ncbi:exported hypothetical protein [Candidatus Zixiibacteriota bacterium]|nr:exported hypothetical protein [candidate division Zixibacteria bacterium]
MKKRIPIILITALLLCFSSGMAVEKKGGGKITPPPDRELTIPDSNAGNQKNKEKKEKGSDKKEYDEFIDRNGNGIDDRAETKREETVDPGKDSAKADPQK